MFDTLIRNGRVIDGTGAPWRVADIGVRDGRIAAMGGLAGAPARVVIDAAGKVVCPGFVDAHSHSDLAALARPGHEARIMQGVTTEVVGMCGLSVAPASPAALEAMSEYFITVLGGRPEPGRGYSVAELLAEWDRRTAVNLAYCAPHATLRVEVRGMRGGPATEEELARMKRLLAQAMDEGAVGLSTGLTYFPSSEADTDELIALAKVVAARGGVYTTHMRNYGDGFAESLEEVIEIGRASGAAVHVAHFRLSAGAKGRADEMLERVDRARRGGVDITIDCYPYLMGCTLLGYFVLKSDALDGGKDALLEKLRDPAARRQVRLNSLPAPPDEIFIAAAASEANRDLEGKTLRELGELRGKEPIEAACDLLVEEALRVTAIGVKALEEDLERVLAHPACMIGSDSVPAPGRCHPRVYGAFSRVLDEYALRRGLLPLHEAIWKMTGFPAWRFGLTDRGVLKKGLAADIVVFDSSRLRDRATYEQPRRHPEGVEHVMVNGEFVVREGRPAGARPGRALRRD